VAPHGRDAVEIRSDEHVFGVGTTGSGKTELFRFLLRGTRRTLVLDTKNEIKIDGFRQRRSLPLFWTDFDIIYRPRDEDDLPMARMVMEAWRRKNIRIYVDELADMVDFFPITLVALKRVVRTGRSRHVTIWGGTQRPRWVPRYFLSEPRILMVFSLNLEEDRKYVSGIVGDMAKQELPLHDFLYLHKGDMTRPIMMRLNLKDQRLYRRNGKEAA
jgi:hypothetical protein